MNLGPKSLSLLEFETRRLRSLGHHSVFGTVLFHDKKFDTLKISCPQLEHFVSNMENPELDWPDKNLTKKKFGETKDPEEAFLGIHANVRAAMKKHLPWVGLTHTPHTHTISFEVSFT